MRLRNVFSSRFLAALAIAIPVALASPGRAQAHSRFHAHVSFNLAFGSPIFLSPRLPVVRVVTVPVVPVCTVFHPRPVVLQPVVVVRHRRIRRPCFY